MREGANPEQGGLFHMAGTATTFLSIMVKMHFETGTLFSLLKRHFLYLRVANIQEGELMDSLPFTHEINQAR